MKIIKVNWHDSVCYRGWQQSEHETYKPSECSTVGFLVEETKEHIALALSMGEATYNVGDVMVIPKHSVTKTKVLEK